MLIAQGTFSMLVMVEIADQTALWCAREQRMMATRVRTFMYFTAKEKKKNTSFSQATSAVFCQLFASSNVQIYVQTKNLRVWERG